ncbi:MAG: hypothetical protein HOV97_05185 [Nonomuraea sp.]|nr:hypothetical protein [Nonomuraea sp.]
MDQNFPHVEYGVSDLRPPRIHVRSTCHSIFGFQWWVSRVTGYGAWDYHPAFRPFFARKPNRSEDKAVAHHVKHQARRRDRHRTRSYEA